MQQQRFLLKCHSREGEGGNPLLTTARKKKKKMCARRSHRCSLEVKSTPTACRPGSFVHAPVNICQRSVHKYSSPVCLKVPACFTASEYKPESFYGYSKPTVLQSRNYSCQIPYLGGKKDCICPYKLCAGALVVHAIRKHRTSYSYFNPFPCAQWGKMVCFLPNLSRCCKIFVHEMYSKRSNGKERTWSHLKEL